MSQNASKPRIVCLCGSTRFYDAFQKANYDETMAGRIVLSVGFYPHSSAAAGHGEGVGHDSPEKVALDELHKRKIDIADEVLVLNVGGYVGSSTRGEIDYAVSKGKDVRFIEPSTAKPAKVDAAKTPGDAKPEPVKNGRLGRCAEEGLSAFAIGLDLPIGDVRAALRSATSGKGSGKLGVNRAAATFVDILGRQKPSSARALAAGLIYEAAAHLCEHAMQE